MVFVRCFQLEVLCVGGCRESEVEIWGSFERFKQEGHTGEGLAEGEDLRLERGLFLRERGAGEGQLCPCVENFGGLSDRVLVSV